METIDRKIAVAKDCEANIEDIYIVSLSEKSLEREQ